MTAEAGSSGFSRLGLSADLIAVLRSQGITSPTPIQEMAIPDLLAGKDVCGRAATGSGKTLAFGLPLLERVESDAIPGPAALILVPTRELAAQVTDALDELAQVRGLGLVAVYGGVPIRQQTKSLKGGTDILVATPGRLMDLARRRLVDLGHISAVVIDEADQMADLGFLPQVREIMGLIPRGHQTMLFSATLDGQVATLVRDYMEDPVTHAVQGERTIDEAQEHRFIGVHAMDKAKVATAIIASASRVLVFVRTKRGADQVARELRDEGVSVGKVHGDLRQEVRERNLDRFATGRVEALVVTNVAARGLHIDDVDVVIHYDPPEDFKTFVHRSGRTARAGAEGLVVTLVEWDKTLEVEQLQRSAGLNTEIVKMYSNDPRLRDLASFQPGKVDRRPRTAADFSRRVRSRRR